MKRVLLAGLDPATVDYSDPALPPGMNADKIHAGIKLAIDDIPGRAGVPSSVLSNLTIARSSQLNAA
jgi:hypothetical protein